MRVLVAPLKLIVGKKWGPVTVEVEIVDFPETRVAAIEYRGPPEREHEAVAMMIAWRKENNLPLSPERRVYGLHYNDPRRVEPSEYRVDLCVSVDDEVQPNRYGVINKLIAACRCARARHLGSRERVTAAEYLYERWLPASGERFANRPLIFHYVNVGPDVKAHEMITVVYLPLA